MFQTFSFKTSRIVGVIATTALTAGLAISGTAPADAHVTGAKDSSPLTS